MSKHSRFSLRAATLTGRVTRALAYSVALLLPTLASFGPVVGRINASIGVTATPSIGAPSAVPPAYDPAKPTVAILMGNTGTELTDFLGPYEIFAATGAFNVYALAPERTLSPIVNSMQADSGLDVMPHFSFAEFAQLRATPPDVIVIPYIRAYRTSADLAVVDWIKRNAGPKTLVVSICGGAMLLAHTGLLDNRPATSHWSVMAPAQQLYPNVDWRRGERYVETGNIITSAGITAGIDASLAAVKRLAGEEMAQSVARSLNYPYAGYLDNPAYRIDALTMGDQLLVATNAAFPWERSTLGAFLFDGIGEIALAAVLDTYHQSQLVTTQTFAAEQTLIRSRHGLLLMPRHDLQSINGYGRVIVPGDAVPRAAAPVLETRARERGVAVETLATIAGATGRYPFDVTMVDLANRQNRTITQLTSKGLEYPIEHLDVANTGWQRVPVRAAVLVLSGLALAFALRQWLSPQQRKRRAIAQPAAL